MNGVSSSLNRKFGRGKREFWQWCAFLACLITGTIFFYRSYHLDRQVSLHGQLLTVKVFAKIPREHKKRSKIGILHGPAPIYVYAGRSWYRSAVIGSETQVRYSSQYHAYLDPYHKFDKDLFFLAVIIAFDLVILWRTIWLGLYIWYWK